MNKIAFIFPGQGAQYIGMGKEIIENNVQSKAIFDIAKEALDFDLEDVCFNSEEKLNITEYTQPAILTISIAILQAVEALGIFPDYVGGLSLGEYTALVANRSIDFRDAVLLVRKRGQYMEEAALNTKGTMAVVIGSDINLIKEICNQTEGIVDIANYNSNTQSVIAGEAFAVERASKILLEKNFRVIPLKVSGAFHSPLMNDAANKLEIALDKTKIKSFTIPYVTNVTGEIIKTNDPVKDLLVKQVKKPVKWESCIYSLIEEGVDTFIEIGPGKTLTGLIKKIDRSKKAFNVEDIKSLNHLKNTLGV